MTPVTFDPSCFEPCGDDIPIQAAPSQESYGGSEGVILPQAYEATQGETAQQEVDNKKYLVYGVLAAGAGVALYLVYRAVK